MKKYMWLQNWNATYWNCQGAVIDIMAEPTIEMEVDDIPIRDTEPIPESIASQLNPQGVNFSQPTPEQDVETRDIPAATAKVRPHVLHLYGVDDMNTEDVLAYFKDFSPEKIEWINDSSCNIVFPDNPRALTAITSLLQDPSPLTEYPDAEMHSTTLRKSIPFTIPSKTDPALQRTFQNMHLRFATEWDIKEKGAATRSRYYRLYGKDGERLRRASPYARTSDKRNEDGALDVSIEDRLGRKGVDERGTKSRYKSVSGIEGRLGNLSTGGSSRRLDSRLGGKKDNGGRRVVVPERLQGRVRLQKEDDGIGGKELKIPDRLVGRMQRK